MISEVPPEKEFINVETESRVHPYGRYKTINRLDVELVSSITGPDSSFIREVTIKDGEYEVWVLAGEYDDYGYPLQSDERVSDAEFHAISLKQAAIRDGESVSLREIEGLLTSDPPKAAISHLLIAFYYAAKANPAIDRDRLRAYHDRMREQTGHVDTSDPDILMEILKDVLGDEEN